MFDWTHGLGLNAQDVIDISGGKALTQRQASILAKCDKELPGWLEKRVKAYFVSIPRGNGAEPEIKYEDYILSPQWREKAQQAKVRARGRCQVCYSPEELDAHHRTYARLGHEDPMDIIVLCRSCHDLFHKYGRMKR